MTDRDATFLTKATAAPPSYAKILHGLFYKELVYYYVDVCTEIYEYLLFWQVYSLHRESEEADAGVKGWEVLVIC